jgi:protease IV
MIKRLLRWLLRLVVSVLVVLAIILVSDFVSHRYRPGTVLVLELNGPVPERGSVSILGVLNTHEAALNVARRALINAQDDPRIVGLAIKVIDPQMEFAQAQELCDLISDFKKHGKWTSAYIETAGESGSGNLPYLVASTADEVSMMPQGEMNLLGVGVREMFARGMLDWLKVKPNFDAIGQYKSAANVFTQKDFTPAQRREDDALVGDIFDQIVAQTAAHRHLAPDGIRGLIDRAPLTAADGMKARLLDRLEYEDQFDDRIKHYRGEHHEVVGFQAYAREKVLPLHSPSDKIAVIYGLGAIQRGGGGFDPLLSPDSNAMGSDDITKALKDAREDTRVRAVVFRINSPGGSVIASELIRHEVELTAAKKPVVVSMSGYAASGGYWVSTPAARIYAEPGTITGSIGVLGGKFNISGAATALGVNTGLVARGANASMFDAFTDFTPEQAQIFRDQILGDTYKYFLKIVAKNRGMTVDQVNDIAQGRVWTGEQALKIKLVDKLGGLQEALAEAKALAKLSPEAKVQVEELPGQVGVFGRLLGGGQSYAVAETWRPPRALQPLIWMIGESLGRHAAFGEAYCPLMPVM